MKRYFAILSGLLFTAACNQVAGPDWAALPGAESYVLEYGTGVPRQKKLSLRESEKTLLRSYMQELADEGSSIPVSYAPQYVLSGADFSLNFGQDVVVLNLRSAGNTPGGQFARPRRESDNAVLDLLRRRTSTRSLPR